MKKILILPFILAVTLMFGFASIATAQKVKSSKDSTQVIVDKKYCSAYIKGAWENRRYITGKLKNKDGVLKSVYFSISEGAEYDIPAKNIQDALRNGGTVSFKLAAEDVPDSIKGAINLDGIIDEKKYKISYGAPASAAQKASSVKKDTTAGSAADDSLRAPSTAGATNAVALKDAVEKSETLAKVAAMQVTMEKEKSDSLQKVIAWQNQQLAQLEDAKRAAEDAAKQALASVPTGPDTIWGLSSGLTPEQTLDVYHNKEVIKRSEIRSADGKTVFQSNLTAYVETDAAALDPKNADKVSKKIKLSGYLFSKN